MNWLYTRFAAIGAALAAIAIAVARYFQVKAQRDSARAERDYLDAVVDERKAFDEIEAEVDAEYSDLKRESERANKNGEMPRNIRDRNDY